MQSFRRLLAGGAAVFAALAPAPIALSATDVTVSAVNAAGTPIAGSLFVTKVGASQSDGSTLAGGTVTHPVALDGDYTFYVQASNMDGYVRYYNGTAAGTEVKADATVVHLSGTPFSFSMTIPLIATLAGHVQDDQGNPVPNLAVLRNHLGSVRSTTTNASGDYDFGFVRAGTNNVTTAATATLAGGQASVVMPALGAVTQNFTLVRKASVSGTLTDSVSGDPLTNMSVTAYRTSDMAYQDSGYTDAAGHFVLFGLSGDVVLSYQDPLGGYPQTWSGGSDTSATATAITTVPAADVVHNESLTAVPDPFAAPHSLSGTVTSGGVGLGGITVGAVRSDGLVQYSTTTTRDGHWSMSTTDGQFTIKFEPSSGWSTIDPTALPWFTQYYPAAWNAAASTPVTVTGGAAVDGVNTTMVRSGLIHIAATGPPGISVTAGYSLVDPGGVTLRTVTPSSNGSGQIDAFVKPGAYRVFVRGTRPAGPDTVPVVSQWYGASGGMRARSLATPITVASGQTFNGATVVLPTTFVALKPPVIAGALVMGRTLTSSPGIWNQETDSTFTYRWTRGATAIGGRSSYTTTFADVGAAITVTVAGTHNGLHGTVSRTVRIAKLASGTVAAVTSPTAGAVRVVVRVKGAGHTPTGVVEIRRNGILVGAFRLRSGRGAATFVGQPSGFRRYQVTYRGSIKHLPSRSTKVGVQIR